MTNLSENVLTVLNRSVIVNALVDGRNEQKQNKQTKDTTMNTTNTQHTPGPWKVLNDLASGHLVPIDAENGIHVALAFTNPPYPQHEANACLIAAAPDLLAACKLALSEFGSRPADCYPASQNQFDTLTAAIARAESPATASRVR